MKLILFFLFVPCLHTYCQADLTKGLAAYYPFNNDAHDASGNGNHAVFNNAFLVNDRNGKPYSAYNFNGENQYIRIKNSRSLNFSGPFSISAWVLVKGFYTGACHGNRIIMKGDTEYLDGNYMLGFDDNYYTNGNNCNNRVVDKSHQTFYGAAISEVIPNPEFVQTGKWNLITYIYDGSNARLYVNCNLYGKGKLTNYSFSNRYDLFFGRLNNDQYPYWFNGSLDEVRMYNRALTEEEIGILCNDKKEDVPAADFVYTISNCKTVQFKVSKKENVKSLKFDFGDNSTSAKETATHEYKKPGNYVVKLVAKGSGNEQIIIEKKIRISIPEAAFSYSIADQGKEVKFTIQNRQKLKYTWLFGDGGKSNKEKKITHTYQQAGTYNAMLIAENPVGCRDTAIQQIVIAEVLPPAPDPEIVTILTKIDTTASIRETRPVLENRNKNVVKNIEVIHDSLSITFYDNAEVDGDSITIIYNGQIIASHLLLTDKPKEFKIAIDKTKAINELVMYAENLGSIPPNTALMIIYDGEKRHELSISSNNSTNGAVNFIFRK